MKKWYDNLDDKNIEDLLKKLDSLNDTTSDFDNKLLNRLFQTKSKSLPKGVKKNYSNRIILSIAAILLVIILPLILIYYAGLNEPDSFSPLVKTINPVLFMMNDVKITEDDIPVKHTLGSGLKEGYQIETGSGSECHLLINNGIFILKENSAVVISKALPGGFISEIKLLTGKIIVSIDEPEKMMLIHTPSSTIKVSGTNFFIGVGRDNSSLIGVNKGSLEIEYILNSKKTETVLNENECLFISMQHTEFYPLSKDMLIELAETESYKTINLTDDARVSLKAFTEDVLLNIDNERYYHFNNSIDFFIEPGDHFFRIEKEDYVTVNLELKLVTGESIEKNVNLTLEKEEVKEEAKEEDDIQVDSYRKDFLYEKKDINESWSFKKIYRENDQQNTVLGFLEDNGTIYAQTKKYLLCLDIELNILWEKSLEDEGISFLAKPVFCGSGILAFTSDGRLFFIQKESGETVDTALLEESRHPYNLFTSYDHNVFFTSAGGIFLSDNTSAPLSFHLFIDIKKPTPPLIIDEKIFLTSMDNTRIEAYNLPGEKLWSSNLFHKGSSPVFYLDDCLFTCDSFGYIYKYSLDGKLMEKLLLPIGTTSGITTDGHYLYLLSDDGKLNQLSISFIKLTNSIQIDSDPDKNCYYFKSPLIREHKIYIGTSSGELFIINTDTFIKEEKLDISTGSVSCSVYPLSGRGFITGTVNGEVLLLINKNLDEGEE